MKRSLRGAVLTLAFLSALVGAESATAGGRHGRGGIHLATDGVRISVGGFRPGLSFRIGALPFGLSPPLHHPYDRHLYGRHYRRPSRYSHWSYYGPRNRYVRHYAPPYRYFRYYGEPYYAEPYYLERPAYKAPVMTRVWVPGTMSPQGYLGGYWEVRPLEIGPAAGADGKPAADGRRPAAP